VIDAADDLHRERVRLGGPVGGGGINNAGPPLSPCSYYSSTRDGTAPCRHRTTPAMAVPSASSAGHISHERPGLDAAAARGLAPGSRRRPKIAGQGNG
jgi:hypothetical protein